MTVIFLHDLNAAGFQDLDALIAEADNRYGTAIADRLCPHNGPLGSSQEVAAILPDDMPAEDMELIGNLVTLSDYQGSKSL